MKIIVKKEIEADVSQVKFKVGDSFTFEMADGEKVEAIAAQENEDGNMIFIFQDCLRQVYPMYNYYVKNGYAEYEESDLCKYLNNKLFNKFPNEIRKRMLTFDNGYMLDIPTEKQILGINRLGNPESVDVKQLSVMQQWKNRIAYKGYGANKLTWYWLKSTNDIFNSLFITVGNNGTCSFHSCDDNGGVRLLFKLKN